MRQRDDEHDDAEIGGEDADLLASERLHQQRRENGHRTCRQHPDGQPHRPKYPPHRHAEQRDRRKPEVPRVVADAAPNHLDDVRRTGDADAKIRSVELVDCGFDSANQRTWVVSRRQDDDVARPMIVGDQKTTPERTLFGVLEVVRTVGEASDAGHPRHCGDASSEPPNSLNVRVG